MKVKVFNFFLFLSLFLVLGISFFIYLWNSSKNYPIDRYKSSTSFKILDIHNQPIHNITITDMQNSEISFEIDSLGIATFYDIKDRSVIIKATNYKNDTVVLKNHSLDTIHLIPK